MKLSIDFWQTNLLRHSGPFFQFSTTYISSPRAKVIIEKSQGGDIYGTAIEIGLDLGQLAEKRVWANYEQLFRVVFSCFGGQKKI